MGISMDPTGQEAFRKHKSAFLKPPRLHSPIGMKLQKGQALREVICVATINNIGGESGIDEAGGRVSAAMISNCDLDMSIWASLMLSDEVRFSPAHGPLGILDQWLSVFQRAPCQRSSWTSSTTSIVGWPWWFHQGHPHTSWKELPFCWYWSSFIRKHSSDRERGF